MSGNRCSRSYLSKRQKLVIAPVKIKRMVPARWMIPNDANTSGASALIAITAQRRQRKRASIIRRQEKHRQTRFG